MTKKKSILPRRKWPLIILVMILALLTAATFETVGTAIDKIFGWDDKNPATPSKVSRWSKVLVIGFASLLGLFVGLALVPWVPVIGVLVVIVSAVWLLSTFWEIKNLTKPVIKK